LTLVDVSGLAKPIIFKTIRNELVSKGSVLVCNTSAERYYPLVEDLERLFAAEKSQEPVAFLDNLAQVLTGEEGPYTDLRLLEDRADPSRSRALLAFASAKHERLFSLLDKREFDQIEIIAPADETPRSRVAVHAAQFICQDYRNAKLSRIDSNNLATLFEHLDSRYLDLYSEAGVNFELGLTGSKTQAIAAAVLASVRKVSQAWYLGPKNFDEKRFSSGVGLNRIYEIRV
jgi:hypothetical protein